MARKVCLWGSLAFSASLTVTGFALMIAGNRLALYACYAGLAVALVFAGFFVTDKNMFREGDNNG